MEIKTEKDITGEVAKQLREKAGETQAVFWKAVGLTQSGGSRYESGLTIPKPVRQLLYIRYVAGLKLDTTTTEGCERIKRLSDLAASELAPKKEKIGKALNSAMKSIKSASRDLAGAAEEHY